MSGLETFAPGFILINTARSRNAVARISLLQSTWPKGRLLGQVTEKLLRPVHPSIEGGDRLVESGRSEWFQSALTATISTTLVWLGIFGNHSFPSSRSCISLFMV